MQLSGAHLIDPPLLLVRNKIFYKQKFTTFVRIFESKNLLCG